MKCIKSVDVIGRSTLVKVLLCVSRRTSRHIQTPRWSEKVQSKVKVIYFSCDRWVMMLSRQDSALVFNFIVQCKLQEDKSQ